MGMFSWDCKVCGKAMRRAWNGPSGPEAWREDVVCVPSRGDPMLGAYDGYGGIDGVTIPWLEDIEEADDARESLALARRYVEDMRRLDALMGEVNAALVAAGRTPESYENGAGDAAREVDASAATLAEIEARVVYFTAYHRRCWESAGRPGFQGQSTRSRDQGA